ncbi:MAG TPA: S53 family peptidase, partial [Ktedonobacteraceae bacterium]|nr:S53 family peptidase [Ktedonobacteraceae bacterium]
MYCKIRNILAIALLCVLMAACGSTAAEQRTPVSTTSTPASTPTVASRPSTPQTYPTYVAGSDVCPKSLSFLTSCQTPQSMRTAYGLAPLTTKGFTGKGQTIIDIVSFGSPTLQQDLDAFDRQFGLPNITVQQISPLKVPTSDPNNDRSGWAVETTLDVEIIHALAPEANIVVLTSPVAETEGTLGLPEFRQLLQYAIDHKLGNIVSNSWGASEITLKDAAGQAELQKWDALLKQATTENGMTILSSSGDNGSTDYEDLNATRLSPTPTTSFATDDPWVTSVGGTSLIRNGSAFSERVWNSNSSAGGGGFSQFFATPDYQKTLPASVQSMLKNRRGVPDVSGNAD